ncbi:GDP-mannose 4,6-dehydratase [Escherichia coli]|nr:GDP-mannose 4,6-dehydratase [Escherichia coli]
MYDCSDLWGEPISGKNNILSYMRQRVIVKAENRIIKYAHSITCSSQYLHDQIKKRLMGEPKDVFTVENGVEYDVFAKSNLPSREDVLEGREGTVLGFIGGIKPKLDFDMIAQAARMQPDWTFLFVGPDGTNGDPSFQHALKLSNVLWTGAVAPEEVPAYMKLIDVGMIADLISHTYYNTYGLPVCITRCGNLYGGGDLNFNRIIPQTIQLVLEGKAPEIRSDGTFIRDYFYIEDAVKAYLLLAEKMEEKGLAGEAFNFSNEIQLTVLELVDKILKAMGSELKPRILNQGTHEIKHQYLSAEKARKLLDWKPDYSIDEGLEKTIEWYCEFFQK